MTTFRSAFNRVVSALTICVGSIACWAAHPCDAVLVPRVEMRSEDLSRKLAVLHLFTELLYDQKKNDSDYAAKIGIPGLKFGGTASYSEFRDSLRQIAQKTSYRLDEQESRSLVSRGLDGGAYVAWTQCIQTTQGLQLWFTDESDSQSAVLAIKWVPPPGGEPVRVVLSGIGGTMQTDQTIELTAMSHARFFVRRFAGSSSFTVIANGRVGRGAIGESAKHVWQVPALIIPDPIIRFSVRDEVDGGGVRVNRPYVLDVSVEDARCYGFPDAGLGGVWQNGILKDECGWTGRVVQPRPAVSQPLPNAYIDMRGRKIDGSPFYQRLSFVVSP